MNQEKRELLASMLKQVAPGSDLESIKKRSWSSFEGLAAESDIDQVVESAAQGMQAIDNGRQIAEDQQYALEAIVLPKFRPVVDIIADDFDIPGAPWEHFGAGALKQNITRAIPSIGRIEVPGHPSFPYAGTGFVVGQNLIMTNRHVAEIFARGLGVSHLAFKAGHQAGIDFVQEAKPRATAFLKVQNVVMIHPHWDMALLSVDGLEPNHPALRLSVVSPDDLVGKEIAVVGYPAQDPRNDFQLQMDIFRKKFNVKRLQPGKLRPREQITDNFGNDVFTLTHDASTLGGNSGSAVIDVVSGDVVGLHFGGRYLVSNYCVPAFELARDSRVVDIGVNFRGRAEPTDEWDGKWQSSQAGESTNGLFDKRNSQAQPQNPSPQVSMNSAGAATWTIPIQVTVSMGIPSMSCHGTSSVSSSASNSAAIPASSVAPVLAQESTMKTPIIYGDLEARDGFDSNFLDLDEGTSISLPLLTTNGKLIAAKLEDGSTELRYHKFSIVMHKKRRMALFTASNVDWRPKSRMVNGRKPSRKELSGLGQNDIEQWVTDPRIPDNQQLPDVFYTQDRASFDKGHLVRRDDVCWGESFEDIQMANGDTYHTTNCSPQVAGFNQSTKGEDNWGDLETLVQEQTKAEKAIVLAGPVFGKDDPVFKGKDSHGQVEIRIPQRYWKIIVTKGADGPEAFGFVLEQDLGQVKWEMAVPEKWKQYMKPIREIESLLDGKITLGDLSQFDMYKSSEASKIQSRMRNK